MLRKLTIQNYALIDSLDITFPDGLIIITGETGAGKSILLGAISLLLGSKVNSTIFRDSSKNCVVEAEFDDDLILRRVISPSGRSRSFMNDEPVPLAVLAEISNRIIDIHGQHQHLLLSDSSFQLSVLDRYAGSLTLLNEYQNIYNEHSCALSELDVIIKRIETISLDSEYKEFQLKQLEDAHLVEGELEELEAEQAQLANAESIKNDIQKVISLLNPYETSLSGNLKEVGHLVNKLSSFYPSLSELSIRLESARLELEDMEQELDKIGEGVVLSPSRLEQVEERMSMLYSLMKKHHCDSVEELIKMREDLKNSFSGVETLQEEKCELERKIKALDVRRRELAAELSKRRGEAAPNLSQKIESAVRSLEMPKAIFRIELTRSEKLTPSGEDSLHFLFSANGDARLSDISKVASGGELSRVMLALKGVMAQLTTLPTMIFDEIDTGVSGKIADKMGDMIGKMGESMQIFAITHLPQIASKKGAHFLVYKEYGEGGANTYIKELSTDERVEELARMLSGSQMSEAAIENAKVLLLGL